MNNEIIISNIDPQNIIIEGGGSTIGITTVYVNDVDVTVGSAAYVVVPTKLSELQNNMGFITSAQEQDPTVPYYVKQITVSDINNWNSKQDELVSGSNIKTINGESILGEGNLVVDTSYTAGTGINISDENVISNTITSYDDLTDLPTIPTAVSELTNDADYVSSSVLSPVAFSGDYDDLVDKPTIPTSTSDLVNNSGFITNRVDDLINYYTRDFLFGLLPKVSDEDTFINLSGTYASKLKLDLNSTTLSQDATPTPDNPQDIHTISGSNTIQIKDSNNITQQEADIDLKSKNLAYTGWVDSAINRMANLSYTTLEMLDNKECLKVKEQAGYNDYDNKYLFKTDFKENTQYTFSFDLYTTNSNNFGNLAIQYTDGTTTEISGIANAWKHISITTTSGKSVKYLRANWRSGYAYIDINTFMINEGAQELPYVPYYDYGEYCKIGTYADRIFRNVEGDPDYDSERTGTWYIKKNIGKVVLDGSESWQVTTRSNGYQFQTSNSTGKIIQNTEIGMMSNYFKGIKFSDRDSINESIYAYNADSDIRILTNVENTTANFKTWLSTHNTDVYYVLATPTYTEITGELEDQLEEIYQNTMSYTGQTNISQVNDDLPFTISATTLKDISNL